MAKQTEQTKERVMNSSNPYSYRGTLPAVLAGLIVGTSGLALDKAHLAAAPAGNIEVGELTPVDVLPQIAALPTVIVSAPRLAMTVEQGRA
jgi:hypothetical protein